MRNTLFRKLFSVRLLTSLSVTLLLFSVCHNKAFAQDYNWRWIKGSDTVIQYGVYGTIESPAAANIPGSRRSTSTGWIDSNNQFWLFGGYGYSATGSSGRLNDLWKYNQSTGNWTWMKGSNTINQSGIYGTRGVPSSTNTPGARNHIVDWTDQNGNFWLFGGYGFDTTGRCWYLNDLWKYNPSTNNWTWMKGSDETTQSGVYGLQGVPSPLNTPGARGYAASWTDNDGKFWLFGGYGYLPSGQPNSLNDLWKYDPDTNNWTWMKGSNTITKYAVYGTQGVEATTNTPGVIQDARGWTDTNNNLWLFGGWGYTSSGMGGRLNDLWKYNQSTGNWTWVKGSGLINQNGTYGTIKVADETNTPGGREEYIPWTDSNNNMWLFGGVGYPASGSSGHLNDIWMYNPNNNHWTWMKGPNSCDQNGIYGTLGTAAQTNTPGARQRSFCWIDSNERVWLFGGYGYDGYGNKDHLNDLWCLEDSNRSMELDYFLIY